jgi:hypothetical protein
MSRRSQAIVAAVCLAVTRPASADDRGLAVLVGPSDGDPIVLKIWVRILCDEANLIDSSRLVAFGLSGSIACG